MMLIEEKKYEILMAEYLKEMYIPFEREYLFHVEYCKERKLSDKPRRWRMDFAILKPKISIEIEGGIFKDKDGSQGRHVRPIGFINDCIKYNMATMLGWRVYRIPTIFFKKSHYANLHILLKNICEEYQSLLPPKRQEGYPDQNLHHSQSCL